VRRGERPFGQLPRPLLAGFFVLLLAQIVHHHFNRPDLVAEYRPLRAPYAVETYRAMAMGSERLTAYLLAIRLQLHDNQVGQHFSYNQIDYGVLIDWLQHISRLDPTSEYPMLLASRVYTATRDPQRLRRIIGYIEHEFDTDPQLHWRRLAEASVMARHRLGDLELALRLADKLARQPARVEMPHWARDLQFLLLAELNELEAAIAIIQAMIQSGSITDVDELRFLEEKLSEFQQKLFESQQSG
jgi:hypothetical protein